MDLCRTLGLAALAEGVESEQQAGALRNLRCGLGQGFYLSRPLDTETATALLAQGSSLSRYTNQLMGHTTRREKNWRKQVTGDQPAPPEANSADGQPSGMNDSPVA